MLLRLSLMDPAAYLDNDSLKPQRLQFKLQSRSDGAATNFDMGRTISLEEMFYDNFTTTDKEDQIKTITNKTFAAEFVQKLKNYRLIEE